MKYKNVPPDGTSVIYLKRNATEEERYTLLLAVRDAVALMFHVPAHLINVTEQSFQSSPDGCKKQKKYDLTFI